MDYTCSKTKVGTPQEAMSITFYTKDGSVMIVESGHQNFEKIKQMVMNDQQGVEALDPDLCRDLIDAGFRIQNALAPYSGDFKYENGLLFYKNKKISSKVAKTMLNAIDEGDPEDTAGALFNFVQKLYDGVDSFRVVNNLYDWVRDRSLVITDQGNIVAYKSVVATEDEEGNEIFKSHHSGQAFSVKVDGVDVPTGHVPQKIGSIVEMPRHLVDDDPTNTCSHGLHAGTKEYASSFGSQTDKILKVVIDPRDIVSIPKDSSGQKIRCCKYKIEEKIDKEITVPVVKESEEPTEEEQESSLGFWARFFHKGTT